MSTVTIAAITIALIAIAVAMWAILRMRNTKRLRGKFGPEYDHLVEREGGRARAETELTHREKRVDKLNIRSLTAEESGRFAAAWRQQQSRFVDDPRGAVSEADALITEVMTARGYPAANFQTQVADISVDHALVATNYREAHEIAERSRQDKSSTEELRRAMICYRALFEDLLDAKVVKLEPEEVKK